MTKEMTPLERAARALHSAVNRGLGVTLDWDELAERVKASYQDQCRFVLEAIRDPSEPMIAAGAAAPFSHLDEHDAEHLWQATVDVVLADT